MAQTRAEKKPRHQTYKLGDELPNQPAQSYRVNVGDVIVVTEGVYSSYRVVGVLIRTPESRPISDLMAAFKTSLKMLKEGDQYWQYSGPASPTAFVEMCVAGGWYAPKVHEFFLDDHGTTPSGYFTEFTPPAYGGTDDKPHPNAPEKEGST